MLAKMSLFWTDGSKTCSPKKTVEQKSSTKSVVPSQDPDEKKSPDSDPTSDSTKGERLEPSDQARGANHDGKMAAETETVTPKENSSEATPKSANEKSDKDKEPQAHSEKESEDKKEANKGGEKGKQKEGKVCKSREDSGTAFKRKLEEERTAKTDTGSAKDESTSARAAKNVQIKKMKHSHEISLKSANAISSSLSSSLLESQEGEEDARKGKRKLRSPESGINERKLPKTEDEEPEPVKQVEPVLELTEATADEQADDDVSSVTASPTKGVVCVERQSSNDIHDSKSAVMSTSSLSDRSGLDETDFGSTLIHPDPEEEFSFTKLPTIPEVDRRREISNVDALAADQERDRARAEKLLAAFDDSDEEK